MSFKQKDKQYIANTYGRFDLHLVSGKGSFVYDDEGKEYVDMATGIAVNTFGVADEAWTEAVTAQLAQIQHTSNLYYSTPCIRLAELLCLRTGAKKVFFGNSGAEANECAIKVARKWAQDTYGVGDYTIITLKNSFHGRTVTTLAATGQDVFHKDFNPFPQGFAYATANDLQSVEACFEQGKIAAVMMELVQGEGGVIALDKGFVLGVERLCREKGALLMIDEVQTGNGRCGNLYAFQGYGISPDVVSTAKGLGGGLPIGATMLFERVENTLTAGSHGSTFGGNPIAAAGAVSVIERIDEELLLGVREKSAYIFSELSGAEGIVSVSGLGLMIGVGTQKDVNEVLKACFEMGVLPIKAKNKLRLLPALNIPMSALKRAVAVIKAAAKGERI
ncbi:MAG: aminotransferase class III-fold pyridoxal phosphate-dependent enzyme [Clostridiales bacterium]|nr:aminotransferase class III-fold pyridoxal phosphate-dependent enzyme [Clostridiales bacterium]